MRKLIPVAVLTLFTAIALAQSTLTPEQRQACQKTYSSTVNQCATGLSFLEPITRAGAQKSCVQGAKLARDVCLNSGPPPTCQESCQAAYNNAAAFCEQNYDTSICGGIASCEASILALRADCVNLATTTFNQCVAGCPLQ